MTKATSPVSSGVSVGSGVELGEGIGDDSGVSGRSASGVDVASFWLWRVVHDNLDGLPRLDAHVLYWTREIPLRRPRLPDGAVPGREISHTDSALITLIADIRKGVVALDREARSSQGLAALILNLDDQRSGQTRHGEIELGDLA